MHLLFNRPVRDQAFKVMNAFVIKVKEFAERMPDTAIVEQLNTPTSEEAAVAAAQGAGMAGVLGGATKGIAGWAVSSLQSRVSRVHHLDKDELY
jgi:SCY1-like protein 1